MIPRWLKEQEGPPAWASAARLGNLLGAVALGVTDRLEGVLGSGFEGSIQWVAALQWVERFPGIRPGDLARALDIGTPAVSGLVSRLRKDGLSAFATCRHCDWSVCRMDPEVPCPVVLITARRSGSTGRAGDVPELTPCYEDRRTIEGAEPPIHLWLEPANVAFELGRERRVDVLCRGPWPGRIDLERSPEGHIALYAWERATFTVLEADREIFVEGRALGLRTPRGTTMRRRVESLFGKFETRRRRSPRRWL